jgi:hypothetical protein
VLDAELHTFSRTSGSSIAARFSRGERSTCACSGPPTYSTNLPSSSLSAVSTSSSSSTDSAAHVSLHPPPARPRALTVQEGDELLSCSLRAQGKSYRVEAVDGIQSQNDIVVLQFVNEHSDWVELVVLVRFHGGRSISGDGEGVAG